MGLFPQNDLLQMQSRIEAPALVDADVLQPTAQKMLLAGQAAGHLQQLSSQLALEKAQRKAEMAKTDYDIQHNEWLTTQAQKIFDAEAAKNQADTATSRATAATQANALAAAQAAAPFVTTIGTAQGQAAQITADAARLSAVAGKDFNSLAPQDQKVWLDQALAAAQFRGGTGAMPLSPGARPGATPAPLSIPKMSASIRPPILAGATVGAPGAPAPAPSGQPTVGQVEPGDAYASMQAQASAANPDNPGDALAVLLTRRGAASHEVPDNDGNTWAVTMLRDGSVYSRTFMGNKNPSIKLLQSQDTGFQMAQDALPELQAKLQAYTKEHGNKPGFLGSLQSFWATLAGSAPDTTGTAAGALSSVLKKSVGSWYEDKTTRELRTSMASFNQVVANKVDGESLKSLADTLPNIQGLANPDTLQETINTLANRLKEQRAVIQSKMAPRQGAPDSLAAQAPKTAVAAPGGKKPSSRFYIGQRGVDNLGRNVIYTARGWVVSN